MEAKLDDEQGMLEEEAVQVAGVHEPFALADQKHFEVGTLGMGRPSTRRTLGLEVVNQRPIEQGKEGAIVLDNGIVGQQSSHDRLVKEIGRGYQSKKLLLLGEMGFLLRCKRSFAAVKENRTFVLSVK